MIQELERKGYKKHAPNKYHVDYEKVPDDIDNTELYSILQNIRNKQGHIVVKIGRESATIQKELDIVKVLETAKIPGYIRYVCIPENHKNVLILPYFSDGSLRTFCWEPEYFPVLKSVILQAIMSSFVAYHTCGFIHGDFHLDNIILKKTKEREIVYKYDDDTHSVSIATNGYKIVIMDFESSWIVEEREIGIQMYWLNLQNMISRINTDLKTNTGDIIQMKNHNKIMQFIEMNIGRKGNPENTIQMLDKITDFEIIENPLSS
jgi:serine/threonine protein kinase